jgi:hypothetical protein
MPRKIIITVDYEIFGNGTGDVRQHVVDATQRMAAVCRRYSAPLTIFFEIEEFMAFERGRVALSEHLGYDPAQLIRDQISSLSAEGHDIQLHVHPQWYGASFVAGKWQLQPEVETIDALFATADLASDYVRSRKEVIESLLADRSAKPVIAYRAGAFSARPGARLLAALRENGFHFESSVVRGLHRESGHYSLDYRGVESMEPMWRVSDDVAQEDLEGAVWEVPIYSETKRRYRQLTLSRLKAKFSKNVPKEQQKAMVGRFATPTRPLKMLKMLLEPVPIKLDYHNLSPKDLLRMIRSAPAPTDPALPDVLVLIGHSKEHIDDEGFDRFLAAVAAEPDLDVVTFHEAAADLGL